MTPSCSSPRYSTALRVSRDLILRSFVFVNVLDRAVRASVWGRGLRSLGYGHPPPPMARPPPPQPIRPQLKIYRTKNPEGPRICYYFACLKPHGLFRFLAGDHYGKGKSIRDER